MRSGVWGRRRGANHTNLPSLNKLLGVESHRRVGVTDSGGKEAIEDRVLVFKRKGLFVLFSRHKIDRWVNVKYVQNALVLTELKRYVFEPLRNAT